MAKSRNRSNNRAKGRSFSRRTGQRRYKRICHIATEGTKTEPLYLNRINQLLRAENKDVIISLVSTQNSSPHSVLKAMNQSLKKEPLGVNDLAYIIVDRDNWSATALANLASWAKQDPRHKIIISNPCFELWLLLHFEDACGGITKNQCKRRLVKHILDANNPRNIANKITMNNINDACVRAKANHTNSASTPTTAGCRVAPGDTTMYELIDTIFI